MHPKAQHYVPQVYLRNFSIKRKKQYLVFCYDKATGKIFKSNIKNVAQETGFYDFIDDDGEKKSIEEFLGALEDQSKIAFESVCSEPSINTVFAHQTALANFIAYQMSRTIIFRAEHLDTIQGVNTRLKNDGIEFPIPSENELKWFQAFFILRNTPLFANILLEMKWALILNETGKSFWTSDHPIIRYNPHKSEFVSNLGLISKGIQLHIPLSPKLALTIADPQEYANVQPVIMAILPNIEFNNSRQVIYSRQYLFSIDTDFELARQMIREKPELGDPNRPRVVVN
jgi:hypothetical protein